MENPDIVSNYTNYHKFRTRYHRDQMWYSRGMWFGDSPLDSMESVFLLQLVLVFATCRGLYFLLRPLKQPQSICNILGGIILGPSVLGRNKKFFDSIFPLKQSSVLTLIAALGVLCFVFITAVKTDINMIRKSSRKVWIIGIMSLIVPSITNFFFYHKLHKFLPGFSCVSCISLISYASSMTYFPVIVQALDELNILHSELGQLATAASLVNQLIGLVLSCLAYAAAQNSPSQAVLAVLCIFGVVLFIIFAIRPAILWVIRTTPEDKLVPETHIIAIILAMLVMGVVSDMFGGAFFVGVLFMGLIIPDGPPLGSTLMQKFDLFVSELFMPLFFAQIGYNTDISLIRDWKAFGVLLFIVVVGHLAKSVSIWVASQFFDVSFRNAFLLSLILNIWGVVDISVLLHWLVRDIIDKESYTSLVLNNLALTALTRQIIQFLYKPQRIGRSRCVEKRVRTLQTTSQDEELRVLVCIHEEKNVHSIISTLEASNPSIQSPLCIYMIHLIQFVGREVPLLVPYRRHNRKVKPDSSSHIMCAFMNYSKNSNGPVTMQPFTLIAPYRTMHATICNLAQDKQIPIMILPLRWGQQADPVKTNEFRKFTAKMLEHAPCTVGILVENSLNIRTDLAMFSCNIQVLFLGGSDDREALTLAIRMSSNPNVSITLCRINLKNCKEDANKIEKLLDDLLVSEFKAKNEYNPCVVCHEIKAKDSYIEVMNLIRSLDRSYDLVIVGKRRASNVNFEEEMAEWMELPELGALGDMFASSAEVNGGKMSVLVMQQHGLEHVDIHQDFIKSSEYENDQLGIC